MKDAMNTCIIFYSLSAVFVIADWHETSLRYAESAVSGLINKVYLFFCLAMLTSNAIMIANENYLLSLSSSLVISCTEIMLLVKMWTKKK